jgi:hypothetical protein
LYRICSISCRFVPEARLWRDADREQDLDQAGPDQPLRRDRGAAFGRIEPVELGIEARQGVVDDLSDLPQRVTRGDAILEIDIAEQRP